MGRYISTILSNLILTIPPTPIPTMRDTEIPPTPILTMRDKEISQTPMGRMGMEEIQDLLNWTDKVRNPSWRMERSMRITNLSHFPVENRNLQCYEYYMIHQPTSTQLDYDNRFKPNDNGAKHSPCRSALGVPFGQFRSFQRKSRKNSFFGRLENQNCRKEDFWQKTRAFIILVLLKHGFISRIELNGVCPGNFPVRK